MKVAAMLYSRIKKDWTLVFCLSVMTLWVNALPALACGVVSARHSGMAFFASYENGAHESYGAVAPKLQVTGCGPGARGKFIMLAMGPDIISKGYNRANSYSGTFLNDRCEIADSPFDASHTITYEQRLERYRIQTKTLHSCVEAVVIDNSRLGLNFPEGQTGCEITRLGNETAIARGGFCFFKISPDSEFSMEYRVRPECGEIDYLKAQGFQPGDFNSGVSVYVAGDTSGHTTDLTHIEMVDARFTIQPAADLIKLSTNFGPGIPRWPASWNPDVHMGDFKIKATNFPEITSTFLIDNQCNSTCKDGLCTSPCEFMIPGAAESYLYKLSEGQAPKLLDIWYQGAIVPAHWQGFVPGEDHQLGYQPFVVGERYRLSYKFAYPDTYYRLAKDGFRQFLIKLAVLRPGDVTVHPLPPLDPMTGIVALYRSLPGVKPLQGLQPNLRNLEISWREPLATLASYLDFEGWPPYYEEICAPTNDHCSSLYHGDGQTTVSVDFTIESLTKPEYQVRDVVVRRVSDILPSYEKAVIKAPHLECQ